MGASRTLLRKLRTTAKPQGTKKGTAGRHLIPQPDQSGPTLEVELHPTKGYRVRSYA